MALGNVLGPFLHGLTFFTLSLTVVFLQYRSHRILLARRLIWLGAFGLCEAFVAWSRLFVQFIPGVAPSLSLARPAFLACGYAFLVAFGAQTFKPDAELPIAPHRLLIALQAFWIILWGVVVGVTYPNFNHTAAVAESLARYTLAFPGGLLVAFGLRSQSYQTVDAKQRNRIRPYLQLVESMAGTFGLLNLFLAPITPFFPSSVMSFSTSFAWAAVGAGFTVGLAKALTTVQLEIESWIESVERLQALAVDRERISRDLHDGIIQSIYAAGLLLEGAQHTIVQDPERAQAQIGRVMDSLNQTIQDIRRYIFDLRSDMPDDDVEPGIRRLLRDFHVNTLLETEMEVTGEVVRIASVERRRHIFQIVREALTNTARHARARWVKINLDYGPETLNMTISDDGVGMESLPISKGYGLRNIRERARLLDGTLRIESAPGQGVTFHLTIPY